MQVELNDMNVRSIEKAHEALHGRSGPVPIIDGDLISNLVDRLAEAIKGKRMAKARSDDLESENDRLERDNAQQDDELSRIRDIVDEAVEFLEECDSTDKLVVKALMSLKEV